MYPRPSAIAYGAAWREVFSDKFCGSRCGRFFHRPVSKRLSQGFNIMATRMKWATEELHRVEPLRQEIEACIVPRRRPVLARNLELRLSDAIPLLKGLAGSSRALLIRQLFQVFNFDERRPALWRLEHKLMQALVLNHLCPGSMPVTSGLDFRLRGVPRSNVREYLANEFSNGFVIKITLGDSSGDRAGADLADSVLDSIESGRSSVKRAAGEDAPPGCESLAEERYIVQQRIDIAHEYRVHSFEDQVILNLTTRRYGDGTVMAERDAPSAFVQNLLDRLPGGFLGGSLLGWDVAKTRDGAFRIVEVNFSGCHLVHRPGFHCSGYFHDPGSGQGNTARLLSHVGAADGVKAIVLADAASHPEENRFYEQVASCLEDWNWTPDV